MSLSAIYPPTYIYNQKSILSCMLLWYYLLCIFLNFSNLYFERKLPYKQCLNWPSKVFAWKMALKTQFENKVRWFRPKYNALWKKISLCLIFSKCVATNQRTGRRGYTKLHLKMLLMQQLVPSKTVEFVFKEHYLEIILEEDAA